jgi:hypothetical protein
MKSFRLFSVVAFCLLFSFSTPRIKAQSGESNLFLPGATLYQAEQALDAILQHLADESQVELIRKIKQPDQKFPENLTKVTIQLESKCNFDQLVRFLDAIKCHEKFLRVEVLSILRFRLQGKWEIRPGLRVSGFVENAPDKIRGQTQNLENKMDAAEAPLFRRDQNLEILSELTGLLPPDTVLTFYGNRDCMIQLRGICPAALSSDLMEKLEKSPFLKDVTSAGIFRDPQTGKDVFALSARCKK